MRKKTDVCRDAAELNMNIYFETVKFVMLSLSKVHRVGRRAQQPTENGDEPNYLKLLLLLLLLLKKVGSARLRESGIHPISPKTPAPQYQPIGRKKRKGKRVEDYSRDRAA